MKERKQWQFKWVVRVRWSREIISTFVFYILNYCVRCCCCFVFVFVCFFLLLWEGSEFVSWHKYKQLYPIWRIILLDIRQNSMCQQTKTPNSTNNRNTCTFRSTVAAFLICCNSFFFVVVISCAEEKSLYIFSFLSFTFLSLCYSLLRYNAVDYKLQCRSFAQ